MKSLFTALALLLGVKPSTAYLTFDNESGRILRTGIKREIHWAQLSDPVPLSKEIKLLRSNVLQRRGEFGPLDASRLLELELECYELGITCQQGHCMRKQLLIRKSFANDGKLKNKRLLKHLTRAFENGSKSLLDMSRELDVPPCNIFRAILSSRLVRLHKKHSKQERKRIIKSMLYECNMEYINEFLSDEREFQQMQTAKRNDIVGYAGHDLRTNIPQKWENQVMDYLDQHNINYVTEDVLRQSDASSTPDFLVLDDLHINNQLIRWIEVKSFYVSGLKENHYILTKSLVNQVNRYVTEFGPGAVILKNGFSDTMIGKLESTLLLDSGPLSDVTMLLP
jgi:hypothetical protein